MTTLIASDTLPGGKHWSMMLWRNSRLKLTDIEGGANVGMLFYNPLNLLERYNAPDTLKCQHTFKLTARTLPLLGHGPHLLLHRRRHGRLARHGLRQHHQGDRSRSRWGETQLPDATATTGSRTATTASWSRPRNTASAGAILPPTSTGSARSWWPMTARMTLDASAAKAGASVELRFEMDTLVLFHTCPHPLNPSPDYPRKPVRYEILDGRPRPPTMPSRLSAPENMRGFENNRIFHVGCCAERDDDDHGKPTRSRRRALPQGRAGGRLLDARRAQGRDAAHRRPRRQSGRRHAVLQRRRSGRALLGDATPFASRATSISAPARSFGRISAGRC